MWPIPMACIFFLKFGSGINLLQLPISILQTTIKQRQLHDTFFFWQNLTKGTILVGGDFIMVLEPQLDTTSQRSNISYSRLRALRGQLFEHQLLDLWLTLNPKNLNYISYPSVYQSYSRLDNFLWDWNVIPLWILCLLFGPIIHHFLTIYPPQTLCLDWSWRFN